MQVDYMILAAYAEVAEDGRLSIVGGDLDTLRVSGGPPAVLHLPLYLAVRVTFDDAECGRDYSSRVELLAPDGEAVLDFAEHPLSPPAPAPNHCTKARFTFAFQNVVMTAYGRHVVRLLVDGVEMRRIPLYVELAETQDQG